MAEPCCAWTLAVEVLVERAGIHHVVGDIKEGGTVQVSGILIGRLIEG